MYGEQISTQTELGTVLVAIHPRDFGYTSEFKCRMYGKQNF